MKNYSLILILLFLSIFIIGDPWDNLTKAPQDLQKIANKIDVDLQEASKYWIKSIAEGRHDKYYELKEFIGYDVLCIRDGNWSPSFRARSEADNKKYQIKGSFDPTRQTVSFRQKFLYKVYQNKKLQELAYNWLLPTFKEISHNDHRLKITFYQIITNLQYYCDNFSLENEMIYLNQCKSTNKMWNFTYKAHQNVISGGQEFRRLETWIFRRVANNDMTISEVNSWLNRLKKDMEF